MQKELAENMAKQAHTLQGEQSADASKLQDDAKRLTEQMDKAPAEAKMASADLASTLAELQARQLLRADSALTDAGNSQLAAVEKQLAELRDGLGSFQGAAMFAGRRLKLIDMQGLTIASRDELLAKLPVHVGDTLAEDSMDKVRAALKQFDEHLGLAMFTTRDGQVEIRIAAPGSSGSLEPPQ